MVFRKVATLFLCLPSQAKLCLPVLRFQHSGASRFREKGFHCYELIQSFGKLR